MGEPRDIGKKAFDVVCKDTARQMVFGWAYVTTERGELQLDHSGEVIKTDTLEKGWYSFVLDSRAGDEMHDYTVKAELVEAFLVSTEKLAAMGLTSENQREGAWCGFKIHDPDLWAKVAAGDYPMFSIGGAALDREIEFDA